MGKGAMDRADAADWYEKLDWAEFVDQMDAWPDDPELTDDIEILGRWANAADGGKNMEASMPFMSEAVVGAVAAA